MKKLFLALMGLGMTASIHAAVGDTFTYDGLDYNILSEDDLTCEVGINKDKFQGDLIIPSKVRFNDKEYTVTAIGEQAFYLDMSITSITIPETVTTIGKEALSRVYHIKELVIPNSVTEIGERVAY
ncbi:MAG: leucine-rich repeat domain-containing protein, partial [Duncaniella sp.]|nr:leucine-rich repeat domain-containing protein [Duncaniella sp.]